MTIRLLTSVLLCAFLAACARTASMFPIAGPLAERVPVPVIEARATGVMGNSGDLTLMLPGGEQCKGRWAVVAGSGATMVALWTQVYGSGFALGQQAGTNRGEALLLCTRGTTITVEFLTGAGTGSGIGVAEDNRGNRFKVLF